MGWEDLPEYLGEVLTPFKAIHQEFLGNRLQVVPCYSLIECGALNREGIHQGPVDIKYHRFNVTAVNKHRPL